MSPCLKIFRYHIQRSVFFISEIITYAIFTASLKAVLYGLDQIKLMNNKKNSLSIGIILSATILGAVFFVSATAPAFSQENTTDLPSTNNNKTHDINNSTLHSNATGGGNGNLSHTDVSNSTVN